MTTKTIKASDLIGPALDWAVAQCEKVSLSGASLGFQVLNWGGVCTGSHKYSPSSDWSQGGPIIEREKITISIWHNKIPELSNVKGDWLYAAAYATDGRKDDSVWADGPSMLIAAMRCYVANQMGVTVDIPEELC